MSASIGRGQFCVNQPILVDNRHAIIKIYEETNEAVVFRDNGQLIQYRPGDLRRLHLEKRLFFTQPAGHLPSANRLTKKQEETIAKREHYCHALMTLDEPHAPIYRDQAIRQAAKEIYDQKPPGGSTVSRWLKRYVSDGYDMERQVVCINARPLRIDGEINELMETILFKYYMKKKRTIAYSYQKFLEAFSHTGYAGSPPTEATFRRREKSLDRLEVIKHREGETAAREAARMTIRGMWLTRILQRVELDSAHFNIGVTDDDGYYMGRLVIYLVICGHSRVIPGYAIDVGKGGENSGSVAQSILNAVSVKSDPSYPYFGIPELFVTDNGPAYLSRDVRNLVSAMGSNLDHAPSRMGWAKPFVESFIRTMRKKFWENTDGYLGKYDPGKYSEDTLKSSAKITISKITRLVAEFIRDEYHHQDHSGLDGMTPHQAWELQVDEYPPVIPENMMDLRIFRGVRKKDRTLSGVKGVNCSYQQFHSPELSQLYHELRGNRKNSKIRIDILVNPLDASGITAIDPRTGARLDVPHSRGIQEGLSFAELNARRRGLKIEHEFGANIINGRMGRRSKVRRSRGELIPEESDEGINEELLFRGTDPLSLMDDEEPTQASAGSFYKDEEIEEARRNYRLYDNDSDEDDEGYEFESM